MEKLLIVDGSNLLFQMFFGMPARIVNQDGKPIQGTLGFVGALLKIIRLVQPTHVVALFDGECHNERKDWDKDYKANRPDYSQMAEEDTPFSQLPDIYAALDDLGIKRMETTVCETDDWVAAYALRYGKEMQVVISSFDSDFFQLITQNVSVLRYRGEKTLLCDEKYIQQKFGVSPCQYVDFKALVGDHADNIKGVKHIGPKRAVELLTAFVDLDGILENTEKIKQSSVRTALLASVERLRLNQRLIRLEGATCLPYELDVLRFQYGGKTTREVLASIGVR